MKCILFFLDLKLSHFFLNLPKRHGFFFIKSRITYVRTSPLPPPPSLPFFFYKWVRSVALWFKSTKRRPEFFTLISHLIIRLRKREEFTSGNRQRKEWSQEEVERKKNKYTKSIYVIQVEATRSFFYFHIVGGSMVFR